jgi:hypothetical protein
MSKVEMNICDEVNHEVDFCPISFCYQTGYVAGPAKTYVPCSAVCTVCLRRELSSHFRNPSPTAIFSLIHPQYLIRANTEYSMTSAQSGHICWKRGIQNKFSSVNISTSFHIFVTLFSLLFVNTLVIF